LAQRLTMTNKNYEMEPCGKGTYQPATNKVLITDCIACPAGKACNELAMGVGLTASAAVVLPVCAKGFFCLKGAPSTHPYTKDAANNFGPCPVGHHCPIGNSVPIACLAGFYSN